MGVTALTLCRLAALFGMSASLYALYVELEVEKAAGLGLEFHAACDRGGMSCSRVLSSSYAHILSHWQLVEKHSALDISNAILGFAFYLFALVHDKVVPGAAGRMLLLVGSVGSLAFSMYLAYVLKVVLKDFCIVCTSMYVANMIIFVTAARRALSPALRSSAASSGPIKVKKQQ
jgi:vitamin-K-epoxide reductase (warfarin-sensitive)